MSDFRTWWLAEVSRLLPARLRQQLSRDAVELRLTLVDGPSGAFVRTVATPDAVTSAWLIEARRRWGPFVSATLSVPIAKCFVRDVQVPTAAASRGDEIVRVDMERTTPFRVANVLSATYRASPYAAGPSTVIRQVILKRSLVAQLLRDAEAARMPLKSIEVIDETGACLPLNLLSFADRRRAAATGWTGWLLVRAAILLAAVWVATFALTVHTLDAQLTAAEADLQSATAQAQADRRQMTAALTAANQLRQPRLRKLSLTPSVAVWNEVTRVLPDGTWLNDLRIDDGALQLDGYSANASQLIALLAASPLLKSVTFTSPVTRDNQRGVERFQIKAQISRVEIAGAPPTPAGAK